MTGPCVGLPSALQAQRQPQLVWPDSHVGVLSAIYHIVAFLTLHSKPA